MCTPLSLANHHIGYCAHIFSVQRCDVTPRGNIGLQVIHMCSDIGWKNILAEISSNYAEIAHPEDVSLYPVLGCIIVMKII